VRARDTVSFIVAAFNVAPYVEAAIMSALGQTDVGVEVIVVDDASSDATPEVVSALAARDSRVTLVRRTERGGPSVARNTAMNLARGTWLAILDADDLVAPQRSRRLIDLATATSADVVADMFERFSGSEPARPTELDREPYSFFVSIPSFLSGNAMFGKDTGLGYLKAMFRADFMRSHAIRHDEKIFIGEDYHLLMSCLLSDARFLVTSERYYKYRVREGSISWRLSKLDVERLLKGHRDTGIDERFRDDAEIKAASRIYVRALERTKILVDVIEHAKTGNLAKALATTLRHPGAWPLLARTGGAAARKRLQLST
jgi:succinoglycan biosynthesis protein ExoO